MDESRSALELIASNCSEDRQDAKVQQFAICVDAKSDSNAEETSLPVDKYPMSSQETTTHSSPVTAKTSESSTEIVDMTHSSPEIINATLSSPEIVNTEQLSPNDVADTHKEDSSGDCESDITTTTTNESKANSSVEYQSDMVLEPREGSPIIHEGFSIVIEPRPRPVISEEERESELRKFLRECLSDGEDNEESTDNHDKLLEEIRNELEDSRHNALTVSKGEKECNGAGGNCDDLNNVDASKKGAGGTSCESAQTPPSSSSVSNAVPKASSENNNGASSVQAQCDKAGSSRSTNDAEGAVGTSAMWHPMCDKKSSKNRSKDPFVPSHSQHSKRSKGRQAKTGLDSDS